MSGPLVLAALLRPADHRDDIRSLVRAAIELERAGFTFVVIDAPPTRDAVFEPFTLGASLAFATHRLGIAVASPTSGLHPYHAARRLASLDHLSGGRAAWLVGAEPDREHAVEYVDVARALWDSWDDDAFVRDVDGGRYYDPAGLHTPHYVGSRYRVRGPLNISRPPQGHVVVIQDLTGATTEPDLRRGRARRRHDRSSLRVAVRSADGPRAHTLRRRRRTRGVAPRRCRRRRTRREHREPGARS